MNSTNIDYYPDTLTANEAKLFNQLYGMITMLPASVLNMPLKNVASSIISGIVMMISGQDDERDARKKIAEMAAAAAADAAAEKAVELELQRLRDLAASAPVRTAVRDD